MPQRGTALCPGEYYHLYNRGNNRQRIFLERDNYLFFLQRLRKYLMPMVDIVAYCLMPTHYHLLIMLREGNLSHQMQIFSISYTKAMNKRFNRVGALFQGAFQLKHVGKDNYLVHLSCYIHLNPVTAGLVGQAEDWEYSSYREYLRLRPGTLPAPSVVLDQFSSPEAYRLYVESYTEDERKVIDDLLFE
ncbi:MAG: transposase [Chloroflexota bacterium]